MKRKPFFIFVVILGLAFAAAMLLSCSKGRCEGCQARTKTYINDVLQYEKTAQVDCGATPGTTVKRSAMDAGKTLTTIVTVTCQ